MELKTGRVVAIKQINKALLSQAELPGILVFSIFLARLLCVLHAQANSEFLPLIQRELELLQQLDHPNIVKFLDYYDTRDSLYFVLEYVEGGSLHALMKRFGVLPESLLALYIAQVLKGLEYLHSKNVIHR